MDAPPPPPGPDMEGPPPPPPGPDAPPPPPGPGTPVGRKKMPKRDYMVIPSVKMKGLQWNKIDSNKIKGTVFETFGEKLTTIKIDLKKLEDNFAAKAVKAPEEKEAAPPSNKPVSILEGKISQNIRKKSVKMFNKISHFFVSI
jgi:hypothetical protein